MPRESTDLGRVLVVRVSDQLYALPLTSVIETMRPLRVDALIGVPAFVPGVAIIRGLPTPVADLAAILGFSNAPAPERFVTIRAGDRQIALAVSGVVGIRNLQELEKATSGLPPLLADAPKRVIETIGVLDGELLIVLRKALKLPDEVWDAVDVQETASWR